MWEWDLSFFFFSFNNIKKHQPLSLPFLNHHQNHLPIQADQEENDTDDDDDDTPHRPLSAAFTMIFTSWLRRSTSRYLILALCSPLLVPLFCATFPCLCVLEVFFRLCRRRGRRRKRRRSVDGCDGDRMLRSEEKLLQRYLEDQLILVAGSVYECRDAEEEEEEDVVDMEYFDNRSPPLQ